MTAHTGGESLVSEAGINLWDGFPRKDLLILNFPIAKGKTILLRKRSVLWLHLMFWFWFCPTSLASDGVSVSNCLWNSWGSSHSPKALDESSSQSRHVTQMSGEMQVGERAQSAALCEHCVGIVWALLSKSLCVGMKPWLTRAPKNFQMLAIG